MVLSEAISVGQNRGDRYSSGDGGKGLGHRSNLVYDRHKDLYCDCPICRI